jgi:hypothetical protein
MTKGMPIPELVKLSDRIWGYLKPPEDGWSKAPSVAEKQVRDAMKELAKQSNNKRLLTLVKHEYPERMINEAVSDYVTGRPTRIVTSSHRIYETQGFFASKLGWMKKKVREIKTKRVGGRVWRTEVI